MLGYYYKYGTAAWTPGLIYSPRWTEYNTFLGLDDLTLPPPLLPPTATGSLITPTIGYIKSSYILTNYLPVSGSLLQNYFEIFAWEFETLKSEVFPVIYEKSLSFDTSDETRMIRKKGFKRN